MKFIEKTIFLFSLTGILTGCTTSSLHPNAETVVVVNSAPRNCQFKGDVNSGVSHQRVASHENIHRDQIIIMKNQAMQLGANTLLITSHNMTYYSNYLVASGKTVQEIETHQVSGKAYYCK
jgi:hypothetical protein